jgi:hypothetical protein
MELSYKEIREYFLNNSEESIKLQEKIFNNYKQDFIKNFSQEDFLNWYFYESSVYLKMFYIAIPNKLKRFFNYILVNDKPFVRCSFYYDKETNIPLYSISIDNSKFKHFLKLEDLEKRYELLLEKFSFSDFVSNKDYLCFEKDIYLETSADFYGNYKKNDKEFCLFRLSKLASNLDLWSIRLSGTDDYSLSKDFLTKEEAFKESDRLKKLKIINYSDLITNNQKEDYYFSN